ncbi:MAG: chemotaxis protein CheX [Pirellulales bacterium]|nr:chemotaxis protein CheX [Pirellulales bacterium]
MILSSKLNKYFLPERYLPKGTEFLSIGVDAEGLIFSGFLRGFDSVGKGYAGDDVGKETGSVTGLIGVHGNVSGFITVNMAEQVALAAVGGLLQEPCPRLSNQVVDGVGELTNIISGGIKKGLYGSPWLFSHITVPSVIIGRNYQIAYAKGLQYLSVAFEHQTDDALLLADRLMQVAISLIRL